MSDAKVLRPVAELDVAQQAKIGARFLAKQIVEAAPSPHADWSKNPPPFHYDNPILHHVLQDARRSPTSLPHGGSKCGNSSSVCGRRL